MTPGGAARVLAALALTWLTGRALTRRLAPELGPAESGAWAGAAGLLFQAALFAALAALGVEPRARWLLAGDVAAVVAASLVRSRSRTAPAASPRFAADPVALFLVGIAGLAWLVFLIAAVGEPMWSTDFLAIWGMKGKAMFLAGSLPGRLFHDPALYWSHREYPLLVPLCLAAIARLAGGWNDQALALLFPMVELWTLLLLAGFLHRRTASVRAAAAGATLTALSFGLYHPMNAGTAEIVLAFGAVVAATAMLDAARSVSPGLSSRACLAALFCAGSKQEGALFSVLLGAVLLLARWKRGATLLRVAAIFIVVPAVHGLALRILRGPAPSRDFDLGLFEPGRWAELAARLGAVFARIASRETALGMIAAVAVAAFLLVTRRGIGDLLLPVLVAQGFSYCVAFSVSAFSPEYAVDAAFPRIFLTLFPVMTLVLSARFSQPPRADAG